jgi:hypothetical protein
MMKVLVACEHSGAVRRAFRARGHAAWSCDLLPASDGSRHHIRGDVAKVLDLPWDMLVAHPVCRYLTNAGVRWLHERPERWALMREAAAFFLAFERADHIPRRCVENPIMHRHALEIVGRRATQYVQPWMFGDPYAKATGLWLTGLPPLVPEKRKCDYASIGRTSG